MSKNEDIFWLSINQIWNNFLASGTPSGVSDENNLEALFSDQKRSEDTPTARKMNSLFAI